MRRTVEILGTLLIAAVILISGSVVATMVYAQHVVSYANVTNPLNIRYVDNDEYASLAVYIGEICTIGWIFIDLDLGNEMPNSQDFTVFADTDIEEIYLVSVGETSDLRYVTYVGTGSDIIDRTFTTPSSGGGAWRYILIEGYIGSTDPDPEPGPDIDAVGWDKP